MFPNNWCTTLLCYFTLILLIFSSGDMEAQRGASHYFGQQHPDSGLDATEGPPGPPTDQSLRRSRWDQWSPGGHLPRGPCAWHTLVL